MKSNTLHVGNNVDILKTFPANVIDSIITDPPYGLTSIVKRFGKEDSAPSKYGKDGAFQRTSKGFMGQEWDGSGIEYSIELWYECLRVAKPGAILMAFGGTRTYHRIASAIEEAGWEIRDMIMWTYGCLSEDTEILTSNGWEHYHKNIDKSQIVCYNIEKDSFELHLPERKFFYENKHPAYRIKSDTTDQIVSRNHRVAVERERKLVFVEAQELKNMERVPTLQKDFSFIQKRQTKILFPQMQWVLQGTGMEKIWKTWWENIKFTGKRKEKSEFWGKERLLERWDNLLQAKRKLPKPTNKIREMSSRIYKHVTKRWLCNGTQIIGGNAIGKAAFKNRSRSSYKSQCGGQQDRKFDVVQEQFRSQKVRTRTEYTTTLATVEEIEYDGNVWCVQVPTGAFVARRNGDVFITGNSGFPKAYDISKGISKKYDDKTAELWNGWKTALKPSIEPMVVAQKPLDGTNVENALKWGVVGFNIDGSRIEYVSEDDKNVGGRNKSTTSTKSYGGDMYFESKTKAEHSRVNDLGRYPANTILGCFCEDKNNHDDDCPVKIMDEQSGYKHPTGKTYGYKDKEYYVQGLLPFNKPQGPSNRGDGGGASRFFYCAKASKAERNSGLQGMEKIQKVYNGKSAESSRDIKDVEQRFTTQPQQNFHPTVKPLKLMEYLCTLTKTPTGGIVLDPFAGSGTTLLAARNVGRNFIGIELSEDYAKIADARLKNV